MRLQTIAIAVVCLISLFIGGCQTAKGPTSTKQNASAAAPNPPQPGTLPPLPDIAVPSVQPQSHSLSAGTVVPVRLLSVVDSSQPVEGFVMGAVTEDVKGSDGRVAIPAESQVAILVREARKTAGVSVLRLGLYSINIAGQQYSLTNGVKDAAQVSFSEDVGKDSAHMSVHLQYNSQVDFKLESALLLK